MRRQIAEAKRLVVKVGSALVTNGGQGLDHGFIADCARQIAALHDEGRQVLLVSSGAIAAGILTLSGEISQVPSTFSAIKVDGRRAYDLARAGDEVALKPRTVTVSAFEVLATRREGALVDLDVRVAVSSGTYVRALARDLGAAFGVGGHLTALRRTRVGPFDVGAAVEEPSADALLAPTDVAARLFPTARLDADAARALGQGKRIPVAVTDAPVVAAIGPGENLVGLVAVRDGITRVLVNFPTSEASP